MAKPKLASPIVLILGLFVIQISSFVIFPPMHPTFHRLIFWGHLIVGIVAGLVILSMAISGLMIAYEVQLMDWANRDLRVSPSAENTTRLGIENLLARGREIQPGQVPSGITWKADPALPVTVTFGREGVHYLDPYTGKDLGSGGKAWHDFFHAATDWHRFLTQTGLERPIGKAITGAGTLLFGLLLVSGIFLWWPRHWRVANLKAALLFNRKLKGRARDWNWHNVIGFWSAFPMLLIILTGLIMSYGWANNILFRLTGNEPPPPRSSPPTMSAGEARRGPPGGEQRRESPPAQPPPNLTGLDTLLTQVQQTHPGWRSISLRMSQAPGGPLPLMLDRGGRGQPHLRTMLNLDLGKQAILPSPDDFQQQNLGRRLRMFARYLHTGELFGFLGQTLAALCTLAAILLVWTGFALAWRRFFGRRRTQS